MDGDGVRERLARLRIETARQLTSLGADLDAVASAAEGSNLDDEHDPEGATIAFEREQLATLREQTQRRLVDLDDALARVDAGTYGRCETCGRPIGEARLEALPATRLCVRCAGQSRYPQ